MQTKVKQAVKEERCDGRSTDKNETFIPDDAHNDLIGELIPGRDEDSLPCPKCGKSHGTIVMAQHAGTADNERYQLAHAYGSTAVTVRDTVSGREFRLSWSEVIQMAIERGIKGGAFKNVKDF